jgi:acyl transferase domain-containing protein
LSAEQAASLKDSATQLAAALNDPGLKASLATFAETVARGP